MKWDFCDASGQKKSPSGVSGLVRAWKVCATVEGLCAGSKGSSATRLSFLDDTHKRRLRVKEEMKSERQPIYLIGNSMDQVQNGNRKNAEFNG